MQNKPNLLDALMNVTSFYTVDYENIANWKLGENKPNSKPIQSQYKPNSRNVQIDINLVKTRNYNNEQRTMNNEQWTIMQNKPKTNPISNPAPMLRMMGWCRGCALPFWVGGGGFRWSGGLKPFRFRSAFFLRTQQSFSSCFSSSQRFWLIWFYR